MTSDVILDEAALQEVTAELLRHEAVFFDVETVGEHRSVPHLNTVTWMGLATDGLCVSIPFGHPIGTEVTGQHKEPRLCTDGKVRRYTVLDYEEPPPQLRAGTVFGILEPVFMSERISKVAHGASFDLASVPKYFGEPVRRPYECNIVLDWMLNENHHAYGLKQRTKQIWGVEYEDSGAGKHIETVPFAKAARYLYLDTKYGWLQYKRNRPGISAEDLDEIYAIELDILEIMVGMRMRGAPVDEDSLVALRKTLSADLEDCETRLYRAAGRKFNVNSVPQKQRILFGSVRDDGQGLKGWKLTGGGKKKKESGQELEPTDYSTDDEALEAFPENELACTIREYQDVAKLLGTYVDSWLGVDPDPAGTTKVARDGKQCQIYDGRIYADFVQYGTRTGRFSCRAPNLQNIPRGSTEHGKLLRDAWCSEPGYMRVTADYGQIELVMLAHFIGSGALFDGFHKGIDPHTMTAALVFGVAPEDVTKDQRQAAKSINFAVVYGAGHNKVAAMIGQSVARAKHILRDHERAFPEIYAYKKAVLDKATSRGYLRTILGRKRRIPELWSKDTGLRMYAERQAFNSLIQGSSADLIKLAMCRTHQNLKAVPGAYMALTVHDELVLGSPIELVDATSDALKDGMLGEGIQKLIRVPLKADVAIGETWGQCK
jgi:DNA polymerase I-like protein with 3'-5' exonuclease and polymerase domains